jgi:hypothetical protein
VRLARVGLETVPGHLAGGVAACRAGLPSHASQITVDSRGNGAKRPIQVVDVRRKGGSPPARAEGAALPLDRLERDADRLDTTDLAAICARGSGSSATGPWSAAASPIS